MCSSGEYPYPIPVENIGNVGRRGLGGGGVPWSTKLKESRKLNWNSQRGWVLEEGEGLRFGYS